MDLRAPWPGTSVPTDADQFQSFEWARAAEHRDDSSTVSRKPNSIRRELGVTASTSREIQYVVDDMQQNAPEECE